MKRLKQVGDGYGILVIIIAPVARRGWELTQGVQVLSFWEL